jgi:hypothetical protein
VRLLNVFDGGVGFKKRCGPSAHITSMQILGRVGQVRYVSPHHATLAASVANVVRFADPKKAMGFTHGIKKERSQKPASRAA